ncbi:nucleotide sugar dehydrogenase [Pelagibacteraceae bacterium]|nr:nucleotide sugar dehydrogenase [Pelagibacteraceae bacterium]
MKKLQGHGLKKNFNKKIAIIGVGYVGLPLAKSFANHFSVKAFDKDESRIKELQKGIDRNLDIKTKDLKNDNLSFTCRYHDIKNCNVYILTLPTPINKKRLPDINLVENATKDLAKILKKKDLIIYESTFYPGTIEDKLIPILEKNSKLLYNKDFFIGYSPERINPGEKIHTLENVKKIISSNNKNSLKQVKEMYQKIIKAGVYQASSIKVAELSKILENTQRFINIALINEVSSLCNKMNLQTKEVIDVASTKWNFMKFYPGFVGGHCVAVDPLYLSFKQKQMKTSSFLITAADKINKDKYFEILDQLNLSFKNLKQKKILILGFTFKENCPDLRNSGTLSLMEILYKRKIKFNIHDPFVKKEELKKETKKDYNIMKNLKASNYDCIIIAVGHTFYKKMGISKIKKLSNKKDCLLFDLKSLFKKDKVDFQL